jgi:hypothetical protein
MRMSVVLLLLKVRLSYATEHGTREMRSYTLQALRTSLKLTSVHSPRPNGPPAASRVLGTLWPKRFAGMVVIIPAGTSKRAS